MSIVTRICHWLGFATLMSVNKMNDFDNHSRRQAALTAIGHRLTMHIFMCEIATWCPWQSLVWLLEVNKDMNMHE